MLTLWEAPSCRAQSTQEDRPIAASSITNASQIIAFRNILAHGYDVVKDEVVCRAFETDLSPLIRDVDALLAARGGRADRRRVP